MKFPPPQLEDSWCKALDQEWKKPYLVDLASFLQKERAKGDVFPKSNDVFAALNATPFDQVNVVIVGQDPYHDVGQAHGLSFSVKPPVPPPPSLKNIYKELQEDLGIPIPEHGCLDKWAKQGVLLLNAILTVRAHTPKSHHGMGWETFTDACVAKLAERSDPIIFVLWGKSAQEKMDNLKIDSHHHVLVAAHPSPFSAHSGFFGCKHFFKNQRSAYKSGKETNQLGFTMSDLSIQNIALNKKLSSLKTDAKVSLSTTAKTEMAAPTKEAAAIKEFELEIEEANRAFALVVEIRKKLESAYDSYKSIQE